MTAAEQPKALPPKKNTQVPQTPPPHIAVGKASKTSTSSEIRDLPFHVKNVRRMNVNKLLFLARGHKKEQRLKELLRYNHDDTVYTPMEKRRHRQVWAYMPKRR